MVIIMEQKLDSFFKSNILSSWLRVKRCYAINYSFFEMKAHLHQEIEIMYIVHGSCKVICWSQEGKKQEYSLKEGEYIFLDCNTPHQLEVAKGIPCRILNLEIALISSGGDYQIKNFTDKSKSVRDFLMMSSHAIICNDKSGSLCRIITELQNQIVNQLDHAEHFVESNLLLAQFLVVMSRQITRRHSSYSGSIYVRKALSFINQSCDSDITVDEISEYVGISLSYLQRLFKEHTGQSLIDKINELRIAKAKLLLENSCLPIIDIAVTVGFHNRQHFTLVFTKLIGCSPSLYRKQKGNKQLFLGFSDDLL